MNITYFEVLLGAQSIWLNCTVMKLIWGWETVIYYSYLSPWTLLQSTRRIWKKRKMPITYWCGPRCSIFFMQQNITAEEGRIKKVGSLLYKETEEGKLKFKLSYLSLLIDWVLLIKINSKGDYHFYRLSSLKIYVLLTALLSLFRPFILLLLCPCRQLPRRNCALYPIVLPFLIGFLWK